MWTVTLHCHALSGSTSRTCHEDCRQLPRSSLASFAKNLESATLLPHSRKQSLLDRLISPFILQLRLIDVSTLSRGFGAVFTVNGYSLLLVRITKEMPGISVALAIGVGLVSSFVQSLGLSQIPLSFTTNSGTRS